MPQQDTPSPRPFLSAHWRHLVMLSWPVEPELLEPFVPSGTELDRFEGRLFVSIVAFRFLDTRLLGLPIPGHRDFEELNLRFYVRREERGELRRGVVFVKEVVPRRAIAWVARGVYNERYVRLPMGHRDDVDAERGGRLRYEWRHRGRTESATAEVAGAPMTLVADSEPAFITEHYWGYVRRRDGGTLEYRVEHPPWRVWHAHLATFECDVAALYGQGFAEPLSRPPSSAFVAAGSAVTVMRGRPLTPDRQTRGRLGAS